MNYDSTIANITSDHFPVILTINVHLKAKNKTHKLTRPKYDECKPDQRLAYNSAFKKEF